MILLLFLAQGARARCVFDETASSTLAGVTFKRHPAREETADGLTYWGVGYQVSLLAAFTAK